MYLYDKNSKTIQYFGEIHLYFQYLFQKYKSDRVDYVMLVRIDFFADGKGNQCKYLNKLGCQQNQRELRNLRLENEIGDTVARQRIH